MAYRIEELQLKNFGMIEKFHCNQFSNINLIIGENGTGKTFLLKALYSAVKSLEEYKRGDDITPINDILSEKLRWTFQVDKLGDIVYKTAEDGPESRLDFRMQLNKKPLNYQFSKSATSKVGTVEPIKSGKEGNSIFIPAKEVLSLFSVILKSREIDKSFGFDDTYYDLAKALRISPSRGKNFTVFANSRKVVRNVIDGKVDYDENSGKWYYKNKKNQKFSIGATSEGVKKIAIMDRLLANGYLNTNSIIFIDEIESALHPKAVCQFLDMIDNIANGVLKQWHLSDLTSVLQDSNATLLDVRTISEYEHSHIEGFKNIPVDELRDHLSEIEKDKPVYVICQSGLRSYIATRILSQNGYDAYNFAGGFRFYEAVMHDRSLVEKETACGMDL